MERQEKLLSEKDEDLFYGKSPEVKVIRNTFMAAGALVREEITKKIWIIPTSQVHE